MSNNNQPAFPTTINREIVRGMTLRDYFAAKVLPVIYTEAINFDESYASFDEVAEDAYRLADAMLKAKDKE
jgi:hypothetical protein